jgi:hypothetical protein
MHILICLCCPVPDHAKTGIGYISLFAIMDAEYVIAVHHIEVVTIITRWEGGGGVRPRKSLIIRKYRTFSDPKLIKIVPWAA